MPATFSPSDLRRAGIGAFFRPRDVRPLGVTYHQIQRLVAARTGLYLAIGGASEAHVLTNAEMKRICEIGVEEAKGKVQVNAGLKECRSAAAVIELARDARDAGVDAIQIYQLDNGHGMIPTIREQEVYWDQILGEIDHPVIINIHYE